MATSSRLYRWFDERLAVGAFGKFLWAQSLKPVPKHINGSFTLGTAAAFLFLCQVVTGILLSLYYQPTFDHAYDSVAAINQSISAGWLIRAVHVWGSHLMVLVMLLHMIRVFCYAGYKKPRELTWVLGGLLFLTTLALCFTGAMLPMDQLAYWGTKVATAILSELPGLGHALLTVVRGGEDVTQTTLSRFFILHILILPAVVMGLIGLHIFLVRRLGISTREDVDVEQKVGYETLMQQQGMPFYPRHALKEILTVIVVFATMITLAVLAPKGLGAKADLMQTESGIRPEWYLLPFYQLVKYFPEWLGFLFVNGLLLLLVLLPFLDRTGGRTPEKRRKALWIGGIVLTLVVLVGILGALSNREMTLFGKRVQFDDQGMPSAVEKK